MQKRFAVKTLILAIAVAFAAVALDEAKADACSDALQVYKMHHVEHYSAEENAAEAMKIEGNKDDGKPFERGRLSCEMTKIRLQYWVEAIERLKTAERLCAKGQYKNECNSKCQSDNLPAVARSVKAVCGGYEKDISECEQKPACKARLDKFRS